MVLLNAHYNFKKARHAFENTQHAFLKSIQSSVIAALPVRRRESNTDRC